jgi:hypothetical protein
VARFYPTGAPVPRELRAADFILRPLGVGHNRLDYETVMASQAQLRVGNEEGWPQASFMLEENLADLQGHEQEFAERKAFAYTILEPCESRCLGCVYIYPRERVLRYYQADAAALAAVGDDQAEVSFWVRTDRLADDLDRRVLEALCLWLRERFAFTKVHVGALGREQRQVAAFQAGGLRLVGRYPVGETAYLSFALDGAG